MALDEVVELIRGDAWPTGYQPLAVMASVVSGGVMRKHIRWLTGLGVTHVTIENGQFTIDNLRKAVVDDLHTLLCYADGRGGCYVAYKYELNDGYSLDKQLRYYGRVQHWAADYYARLSGGEADRSCVGATKTVPLSRDPDVYYDDAAMPFMSADIDGADKSTEGLRERTPSWAERVMTLDEIDDYLVKHVELRRNVITSRMEIRWFAVANLEKQLVFRYFRKPTENESGELVDTAMALQVISYNVGPKIYPDKVDAAFADLGFEEMTVNGMSGYLAVRRKPEEIAALARLMAQDAKQQPPKT